MFTISELICIRESVKINQKDWIKICEGDVSREDFELVNDEMESVIKKTSDIIQRDHEETVAIRSIVLASSN